MTPVLFAKMIDTCFALGRIGYEPVFLSFNDEAHEFSMGVQSIAGADEEEEYAPVILFFTNAGMELHYCREEYKEMLEGMKTALEAKGQEIGLVQHDEPNFAKDLGIAKSTD